MASPALLYPSAGNVMVASAMSLHFSTVPLVTYRLTLPSKQGDLREQI